MNINVRRRCPFNALVPYNMRGARVYIGYPASSTAAQSVHALVYYPYIVWWKLCTFAWRPTPVCLYIGQCWNNASSIYIFICIYTYIWIYIVNQPSSMLSCMWPNTHSKSPSAYPAARLHEWVERGLLQGQPGCAHMRHARTHVAEVICAQIMTHLILMSMLRPLLVCLLGRMVNWHFTRRFIIRVCGAHINWLANMTKRLFGPVDFIRHGIRVV